MKGSKFYQNGGFDFWPSCPKIKCNSLPSLQSYSKYLFYLDKGTFLTNLFVSLMAFGDKMWKLENGNLYLQP